MNVKNFSVVVLLSISLGLAASAGAATITLSHGYGGTGGGEFLAAHSGLLFSPVNLSLAPAAPFETFCVEVNEHVSYGTSYFADVSTAAVYGGAGGGNPDPLSPLTAYLYQKFATSSLVGYNYGGGALRSASADALQHVIWFIEDEEAKAWVDGDSSLMDKFYQDAVLNAGPGIGNVRILNLWTDESRSHAAQDQLVLMPEPTTALVLLSGLALLLGARRRSNQLAAGR
jgi:hypothetical protein